MNPRGLAVCGKLRGLFHNRHGRIQRHRSNGGAGSQSSNAWKRRHEKDPYVKRARMEGSPSRALYKIEEIDKSVAKLFQKKKLKSLKTQNKDGIFCSGDTVLDLGAAPGSWSLYVSRKIGQKGTLVAVDLLDLDDRTLAKMKNKKDGAAFYTVKGDFTSKGIKERILQILSSGVNEEDERKSLEINCVISDMAVNFTGDQLTDALRTMNLCEEALMFAAGSSCFDDEPVADDTSFLSQGGTFLCKYFACGQTYEEDLMNAAAKSFEYTSIIKPNASRKKSAEMYLFASGFKKFDGRM